MLPGPHKTAAHERGLEGELFLPALVAWLPMPGFVLRGGQWGLPGSKAQVGQFPPASQS